ncbi:MAG: guanylate kinase [Bacteroidales bacterium]|nr:guanylate kinase [Bacteroidales bacterium]
MKKNGKLIVISAPSGAGKTTLVKHLLESDLNLAFSISAASRPKRSGEIDGIDYHFISKNDFIKKIENNEFVEWEEVYEGSFYGTLKSEVERIWKEGKHVIFDVDVEGGLNIKQQYPELTLAVFVMPPDVEQLEKRLRARSTENDQSLKTRLDKAVQELGYADRFDVTLVNDDLEKAKKEMLEVVKVFLANK